MTQTLLRRKQKNRCSLEILYDVVRSADPSALKTDIMYSANLSFNSVGGYLKYATGLGLVSIQREPLHSQEGADRSRTRFAVTERGRSFLKVYSDIQDLLNPHLIPSSSCEMLI